MEFTGVKTNDLQDFEVECSVNQATMYPRLRENCSCGQRIGYYQRLIESIIGKKLELLSSNKKLSRNEKLEIVRLETMQELNIVKDCCLRSLTYYPFLTYNDIEGSESMIDVTVPINTGKALKIIDKINRKNAYTKKTKGVKAVGFFPKSSKTEIDLRAYEEKLYSMILENVDDNDLDKDFDQGKLYFPVNKAVISDKPVKIQTSIPTPFSEGDSEDEDSEED